MSTSSLTIKKLINVTEDTLCIYFETPGPLVYRPGQYISLVLKIHGKELRRPYSLSSYPGTDPLPFITVKLVENGAATRYLHQYAKPGDVMEILAPNGRFTLPAIIPSQLFFLAAGSGISPVLGLIKQALHESQCSVVLVYSNRSKESTIFYEELHQLLRQFEGRLTIIWLFSNNKNLLRARLNRSLLEELVKEHAAANRDVLFYTCGPFYYMEMIFITLITMGFKEEQLLKETFALPDDEEEDDGSLIQDKHPPEYTDARVELVLNGTTHTIYLEAGQTILDAALKQKIKLPYSCRNGMCSTCTSQLLEGDIYMHYNQVLTDKEMENGRILTCTAHPVSKSIRLKTG